MRLRTRFVASSRSSMAALFVTGTGTDIGKTFISAGLIRHLRAAAHPVHALKPVLSGFTAETAAGSDAAVLLDALGIPSSDAAIAAIAPWRYAAPFAPNMAARAEGRFLDVDAVIAFCRREIAAHAAGTLIVEGVGGVMVPLDDHRTVLDWIAQLAIPTLLVGGSYLGAISHTLTCIDVMVGRGVPPAAVLVNESANGIELRATVETIAAFARDVPVVALSRAARDLERTAVFERVCATARDSSSAAD